MGVKPDLIVVLVVFVAFHYTYLPGAVLALLLGYLVDLYSSGPMGLNVMGNVLVHYLAFLAARTVFLNSVLLQGGVVFIAILGEGLMLFLLRKFVGLASGPFIPFFSFSLLKGAYTAILALGLFLGILFLLRSFGTKAVTLTAKTLT